LPPFSSAHSLSPHSLLTKRQIHARDDHFSSPLPLFLPARPSPSSRQTAYGYPPAAVRTVLCTSVLFLLSKLSTGQRNVYPHLLAFHSLAPSFGPDLFFLVSPVNPRLSVDYAAQTDTHIFGNKRESQSFSCPFCLRLWLSLTRPFARKLDRNDNLCVSFS